MKTRRTIAAIGLAGAILAGSAGTASAFNPQPEPPASSVDPYGQVTAPFQHRVDRLVLRVGSATWGAR